MGSVLTLTRSRVLFLCVPAQGRMLFPKMVWFIYISLSPRNSGVRC